MRWRLGVLALLAVLMSVGTAFASFDNLTPAEPQPATLQPGLAVSYLEIKARSVDEVEAEGAGDPGEPLPQLDYHTGDGNVLTSQHADFVGAKISGFINFDQPGRWLMATQSNDGVRVRIADQVIINDPDVHSDQFSMNAEINITAPGWYKLNVSYFERKSTSTLQLYWQRPGGTEFEIVPAAAFGHTP
jgi:PA14 domain-containing protein